MSETATLPLKHPITVTLRGNGGEREETIATLSLRKPKARDMRALDSVKGDASRLIALAARLTGHPEKIIDELDGEDFVTLGQLVARFFPGVAAELAGPAG